MITNATATLLNREPSKVLGRAERGETIIIEKFGQPCAVIIPYQQKMTSGAELARRLRHLQPAAEAAAELEKIIAGMDETARKSYDAD